MSNVSYDLIKKGLDVASIRQKSISSNIANINTPNYKVNKVEFEKILADAVGNGKVTMKKTNDMHYGVERIEDIEPIVEKRKTTYVNDNGNNVDIDLEMTELAANEIYYSTLVQQLNARLGNLSYVINK
ncbi:flagellar basal body rod protein FlgB [Alkalibaculum sporogenes]|nr:flagellar basal body rod protein FlgB [Alkalibaculum sporogenes]